jgi:hypothetical protein
MEAIDLLPVCQSDFPTIIFSARKEYLAVVGYSFSLIGILGFKQYDMSVESVLCQSSLSTRSQT